MHQPVSTAAELISFTSGSDPKIIALNNMYKDSSVTDEEWDGFLQRCGFSHHEQSSQFAANRMRYGFQHGRVVVRNDNAIVGGAQVLVHSSPLGQFAHIQRGPIALDDDVVVIRQVVSKLEATARQRGYRSVQVDLFPHQATARTSLLEAGFAYSKAWSRGIPTISVPLSYSDDALYEKMHKRVRHEAKRALRKGVTVSIGNAGAVSDFFELYAATAAYQGFPSFAREYFEYLWQLFGTAGKAQVFVAHHENQPVAGLFNPIVGDQMYFGWGGMSREPHAKALRANFLLHMTAVAWAREHGCSRYDLAGDEPFKQWFRIEAATWPDTLRKLYGPAVGLRWKMLEFGYANPLLRRVTNLARGHLVQYGRMPL